MEIKHTEKRDYEVVDQIICDLCGKVIDEHAYDTDEVTIKHDRGVRYPEGSWGKTIAPDICSDCWCNIILPFLREKGLKTEYKKYDY